MPKTTEKPSKATARTIPDSYWNGPARFAVALTMHAKPHDGAMGTIHYAACFLPKIAGALSRLDTEACNCELSEREEKRRERLTDTAREIAASIGATLYRQNDPRGYPIRLCFPGMVKPGADLSMYSDRLLAVPC